MQNESRRNAILKSFPPLKSEVVDEIELELMPHYVFYKAINKNTKECFCTHCRQNYEESPKNRTYTAIIEHNSKGTCLKCNNPITYKSAGFGRKKIIDRRNICIMRAVDDDLYIRCYKVTQWFEDYNDIPEVEYDEVHRYYLSKEGVQHWKNGYYYQPSLSVSVRWCRRWEIVKSENEPTFSNSYLYNSENNIYTIIGLDELDKTFLKYSCLDRYRELSSQDNMIKYLCEYAKHPNIEYLMKTGFEDLVVNRIDGGTLGYRINWRSNDVKRMLKLNKIEMSLLENCSVRNFTDYKFMCNLAPEFSPQERMGIINNYNGYLHYILEVHNLTGLSIRKMMNYMEKQGGYDKRTIVDWRDYLHQCQQLQYDLHDTAISKPKFLHQEHERLTKLIQYKEDAEAQKRLEERNKKLLDMEYINKKLGLQIVVPKSVGEIINEGKCLNHCVGGYADRHAQGKLTILFLRTIKKPNVPYYTVEISLNGRIMQCRGYGNNLKGNSKSKKIIAFEKEYQEYLDSLFKKENKKVRVSA